MLLLPSALNASENVFLALDRSLYSAGETVWMSGWVTSDGEASELPASRFLYVELLRDGSASVESRVKLKALDGTFSGYMLLDESLESGWYTIRAYTRAQREWPAEALFHTRVLVRGSGSISPESAVPVDSLNGNSGLDALMSFSQERWFRVSLVESDGTPVTGEFSLSVLESGFAGFEFQTLPVRAGFDELPESGREYCQGLDFRVNCVRNRMPESYSLSVMSQDIGYYLSQEIDVDGSQGGSEGQSFHIPELDFPEGTMFTVNVSGSKFIYPVGVEEAFAPAFDYGATYIFPESDGDSSAFSVSPDSVLAFVPADTISAVRITAAKRPSFFKPEKQVGPFNAVFEWRQVKLRDELQKYDAIDLMTFIAANWPTFVCSSGFGPGRSMYTTRSGSITQSVSFSQGVATHRNTASYSPVDLYIDGVRMDSWSEAASLSVRDVQNIYVLRGTEAALYKAAAVVLLELRHFDMDSAEEVSGSRIMNTIGLIPLGYQKPLSFDSTVNRSHQATRYWNPCVRTDGGGQVEIFIPQLPSGSAYFRISGKTSDGRLFRVGEILEY